MTQTTPGGVPPFVNRMMKFLLNSPLHGIVSNNFLLISFTGRKSGKMYTTPVSYSRDGHCLYIFTHATWWKNLIPERPVTLRVRGRDLQGLPEPVAEDKKAVAAGLMDHLRRAPQDAGFYGVSLDENKEPNAKDVEIGAQTAVMIRIRLQ